MCVNGCNEPSGPNEAVENMAANPLDFIEKIDDTCYRIKKGLVPNMKVEGRFFVNSNISHYTFEELEKDSSKNI